MAEQAAPPPSDSFVASSDASSPPASMAWLNHSQHSLNHNLSPDGDRKPLARQKRRRTSPEDQRILEAEYQRNPKPDKAARMEIVSRVALGEKEVQIWFQNRRQNSRRKTRPLMPHEIIPHLRSSFSDSSIDHFSRLVPRTDLDTRSDDGVSAMDDEDAFRTRDQPHAAADTLHATNAAGVHPASSQQYMQVAAARAHLVANDETQTTDDVFSSQETDANSDTAATALTSSQVPGSSQEAAGQPMVGLGYLANRRSASFRESDAVSPAPPQAPQATREDHPPRTLSRSRSGIRLSMTADGKAKVITDEDEGLPPSPQEPQAEPQARAAGLRRSISVVGPHELLALDAPSSGLSSSKLHRSLSGRSRDSRAWEFWCDSHSRNSLAEKAEQESSGSAADAIGLIRANSKGALRPNPNKRNAQISTHSATKRLKTATGKPDRPQLKRVASSYGRLQSKPYPTSSATALDEVTKKPNKEDAEAGELPQTDSDKENWEPSGQAGLRTTSAAAMHQNRRVARKVLGESAVIPSLSSNLGALMAQEKQQKAGASDALKGNVRPSPDEDEEIARFMGAARRDSTRTSVSSGEDLDCIEGLLKLSQGNWK